MIKNEGELFRIYLKTKKIKISDLSKSSGVSRSTIYNWIHQPKLDLNNKALLEEILGEDIFNNFSNKNSSKSPDPFEVKKPGLSNQIGVTVFLNGTSEQLEVAIKQIIKINESLKI